MEERKVLKIKPTHPHKIDANKIKTLDDLAKIIGLMDIHLDDKAVKGLEHLIADNND
ncbi:hypothetical protein [Bacillus thuringiensis]|uniref:hypothetical protein n=1 Tax=Bacillus thuringiensis TaxID=1428 RepID=UPI002AB4CD82|nr:hypothetical protein [Bacillus thuringiensis]MDY7965440.1 hypothetical protein [Bacillus thuringiensis]